MGRVVALEYGGRIAVGLLAGVAGGSLLLIPMACSLFNIDNDIAMQVVGVGFIAASPKNGIEFFS